MKNLGLCLYPTHHHVQNLPTVKWLAPSFMFWKVEMMKMKHKSVVMTGAVISASELWHTVMPSVTECQAAIMPVVSLLNLVIVTYIAISHCVTLKVGLFILVSRAIIMFGAHSQFLTFSVPQPTSVSARMRPKKRQTYQMGPWPAGI